MGYDRVPRTNKIEVVLSDKEKDIVEEMASRERLSVSEYIRCALICDAVTSYNIKAWKLTYENASRKARNFIKRKLGLEGEVLLRFK